MRPMRRSAAAIVAPVLPALTKASASPSFTSLAQRMIEESFFARTTLAGSCISITSPACTTSTPFASDGSRGATRSVSPTSTTRTPSSAAARTAPTTTSSGARSPPIASTAMLTALLIGWTSPPVAGAWLVDLDDLTAGVVAAVAADDVRLLHRTAVGTGRARRRREPPVRRAPLAGLGSRGLALRDGHRFLRVVSGAFGSELELGERRPSGVGGALGVGIVGRLGVDNVLVVHRDARRVVSGARGRERQLQDECVTHELVEIDVDAVEGVGVTLDGPVLVELRDHDREVAGD